VKKEKNKKKKPHKCDFSFWRAEEDSLGGNAADTPTHFATVPRKVAIFLNRKTVLFESSSITQKNKAHPKG